MANTDTTGIDRIGKAVSALLLVDEAGTVDADTWAPFESVFGEDFREGRTGAVLCALVQLQAWMLHDLVDATGKPPQEVLASILDRHRALARQRKEG